MYENKLTLYMSTETMEKSTKRVWGKLESRGFLQKQKRQMKRDTDIH